MNSSAKQPKCHSECKSFRVAFLVINYNIYKIAIYICGIECYSKDRKGVTAHKVVNLLRLVSNCL